MKLLILSFYYPPDLSAGSFRTKALVDSLTNEDPDLRIDVITTMPNRYQSLKTVAPAVERHNQITVRRIELSRHRSGMVDQARSYTSFVSEVLKITRNGKWDAIFATSSRLMTAALGAHIARRLSVPLYLDIRDLFTDTMNDILGRGPSRIILPGLRQLERHTLRQASRVNVVSAGFLPHVRAIAPSQDIRVFTNGIDSDFLNAPEEPNHWNSAAIPLILYAGNIGEGQGLHNILPAAASRMQGRARFRVIGDGGARHHLERSLNAANVSNVELLPPVERGGLLEHYRDADILFVHLNDHPAFHKVLPSKLFEYAATGKPILAGVAGYPADFLRTEVPDAQVFDPCDAGSMIAAFERLKNRQVAIDRHAFRTKYDRRAIMKQMAQDILELQRAPASETRRKLYPFG